ncbi:hypothetical protein KDJ21_007055 [Metabacillus litoralis]|uniref:hypothetical protein n=1 Tax=Metabacillus litoralis TaxID=152268 RepID=UPI001B9512AE|nr:hypothetical protein [Metabacillus litoralis]UHA61408.1 hypothetical protein KDJ21_007055 [Metabacillus litoralis]
MIDMRRITIFAFILLVILYLGSKYVLVDEEKSPTSHTPQRQIVGKEIEVPGEPVFNPTKIGHVEVSSVEEIKARYQQKFEDLEAKTNEKIDALFLEAKNDYQEFSEAGDGSIKELYKKYADEGQKIEDETEAAFKVLYEEISKELVSNGYNVAEAEAFKEKYMEQKELRKSEILEKALSIVRN